MGQISKDAFRKLALLYLIGKFKNGIYSSYRLQKVLYFATKGAGARPFTYYHTGHGQYSRKVRENIDALEAIGLIEKKDLLNANEPGSKWDIKDNPVARRYSEILAKINSGLAQSIEQGIKEFGYLESKILVETAEQDDLLSNTPLGHTIFDENIPNHIETPFSDDECEEIELSLNDNFLDGMNRIMAALESADFDMGEVNKVGSFL